MWCGIAVRCRCGPRCPRADKAHGVRAEAVRPSKNGELFKVLGFQKGLEGPVLGFQSARHLALHREASPGEES